MSQFTPTFPSWQPEPDEPHSKEFCNALSEYLRTCFYQRLTDNSTAYYYFGDKAAQQADAETLENLPSDQIRWESLTNAIKKEVRYKSYLYERLRDDVSRRKLVELAAYGILGHTHVRLSYCEQDNISRRKHLLSLCDMSDTVEPDFMQFLHAEWKSDPVRLFDLGKAGLDIRLFTHTEEMFRALTAPFYCCATENESMIYPNPGDIVLDCGASFGDISLQFALRIGPTGHVYVFEPYEKAIRVLTANMQMNPHLAARLTHVPLAVSSEASSNVGFLGWGGGSRLDKDGALSGAYTVDTTTIDMFVQEHGLRKVDFIKMDIEGAECAALLGASATLRAFRPQLALSIYHKERTDFHHVTKLIDELDLGYKFYLNHHAPNAWDSVLYCKAF